MRDTLGNCGEHDLIMLLDFNLVRPPAPGSIGTWMDLLRGQHVMPSGDTPVAKILPHVHGCAHCKRVGWHVEATDAGTFMITDCPHCRAYRGPAEAAIAALGAGVSCDPAAGVLVHPVSGRVVRSQALAEAAAVREGHVAVLPGTTALEHRRIYLELNVTDLEGKQIGPDINPKLLNRLVGWRPFGRRREVLIQEVRIIDPPGKPAPLPPVPQPQLPPVKHTRSIQIDQPPGP